MVCPTTSVDFSGFRMNLDTIFRWRRDTPIGSRDSHPQQQFWREVIERYSLRRLTMPSDKLVALSALAKDVANASKDVRPQDYLAGIWRQNLSFELRWQMADPPRARPPYRAPSWSWASVDGKVRPGDPSEGRSSYGAKIDEWVVLEAETSWDASAGPFSSVTGGFIVVRSRISAISDYDVTPDSEIQFLGISGNLDALEPDLSRRRRKRPAIWLLESLETNGETAGDRYGEIEFHGHCFGLILLKSPDGQSFRRIGWFSFDEERRDYFATWNRIWGSTAPSEIRIV